MKRANVIKDDNNKKDEIVFGEKVSSPKNSSKPETPHPESRARASETSNHGPVVNLSNVAWNVKIDFNNHYSK